MKHKKKEEKMLVMFNAGQNRSTEKFYVQIFTRDLKILVFVFSNQFRPFPNNKKMGLKAAEIFKIIFNKKIRLHSF